MSTDSSGEKMFMQRQTPFSSIEEPKPNCETLSTQKVIPPRKHGQYQHDYIVVHETQYMLSALLRYAINTLLFFSHLRVYRFCDILQR